MEGNKKSIEGVTPATLKIASAFFACVFYFVCDFYFWASEYYVQNPPYIIIAFIAICLSFASYVYLRKREPERTDSKIYALLACIGFALFIYTLIPRINIATDNDGLNDYVYILDEDNVWQSMQGYPSVNVYLSQSKYWKQFKPGDKYTFQLRKGGLGIWLVNMENVYEEQKRFYDCNDVISCMSVDAIDLSNGQ